MLVFILDTSPVVRDLGVAAGPALRRLRLRTTHLARLDLSTRLAVQPTELTTNIPSAEQGCRGVKGAVVEGACEVQVS
jgi:hypothetical protein